MTAAARAEAVRMDRIMEVFSWLADIAMPVNGMATPPVDTRDELRRASPFAPRLPARHHGDTENQALEWK
jgi:hypothetical protein